jgi:predicted peptidase
VRAQDAPPAGFEARTYRGANGAAMPYRIFVPPSYDVKKKFPLVLWLHGAAGRGNDNLLQISGGNEPGTHIWTKPENQAKLPAFVLAPQCPEDELWANHQTGEMNAPLRMAIEILGAVEKEYTIDLDRVYVAGQSMGGEGTWSLMQHQPTRFAAALPLCAATRFTNLQGIVRVPIWIFQGAEDPVVHVAGAREMAEALRKAGGQPRYSEYPGVGHQVWEKAFVEPELVAWVAAQKRGK